MFKNLYIKLKRVYRVFFKRNNKLEMRKYYWKNRAKCRAYSDEYYQKNKERLKEKARERRKNNKVWSYTINKKQ